MKSTLMPVLIIATLFCATPLFAADAAAGKDVFLKKCATCHGQNGEGKAALAKALKVEFRHLGSREVQAKSDAELKKITLEGTGKMKPVREFDPKTADDVLAFLRTLEKK